MRTLPGDARYTRFTHGKELSKAGQAMSGDDPYLLRNKSKRDLVLHTPAQMRDFFKGDGKLHTKQQDASMGAYFLRSLGQCVGAQNGPRWHQTRYHLEQFFSAIEAASMITDFQRVLNNWAQTLPDNAASQQIGDRKFLTDSVEICRQLPFRMIAMCLYGNMLTSERFDTLWRLNKVHEKVTQYTFFGTWENMPYYHLLPTAANRVLAEYEHGWKEFNLEIINAARKSNTSCRAARMFQVVESGDMTMDMYLQSLDEILFTNIDVTSAQFAYGLINMGKSAAAGRRLYDEVSTVAVEEDEIDFYARKDDTFLHKMYLEILRSNPPIWFTFPETTAVEKRIDGFLIPAGTNVVIDTLRLNKSSPIWGNTGHEFHPERWDHITTGQARYSWLGYGMGPRKCLGKNFANIILKLFLISVSRHFTLDAGEGAVQIKRDRFTCVPEQLVVFEQR
ncbi:hypothetical protein ASPVEDRAFT_81154 [Aspergillus versicolor CBS 583.65]|uniref:Cytochrome P450 n=1 Tax=Aspergillus versicolor CBS 583.65 TaxID=1036611 RepID=A0A1L9PDF4_ASPVE|nr:uncharacterized protein ASPVEDRAFT_81154 [Aspergillus versicolor CBS 583.65]OJI99540.1 hypothetical protein ASPVEDRAFT_81154 [Aspergillus versicolor CBS 583.65]